jgi:SAM-dependent methyltransferase
MTNYNVFAKFYDLAMGDRRSHSTIVLKLIAKHNPKSKKILELACGTGSILKPLSKKYKVYGLDISKGMLDIARGKVPEAVLSSQSMVDFKIAEKFDVIYCVFDSINHLPAFAQWENVFRNAHKHLNPGGLFIFDMNTQEKLKVISSSLPIVRNLGKAVMVMAVTPGEKGTTNWDITVFEHMAGNNYRRWDDKAKEISFPVEKVEAKLKRLYREIKIIPAEKNSFNGEDGRIFFCCKK